MSNISEPIILSVDLKELTNRVNLGNLDSNAEDYTGTGVFDVLAAEFKHHILEEYKAGRITGTDYATAVVSLLQHALTQAVAFLRDRGASRRADLDTEAKLELMKQQGAGLIANSKQGLIKLMADGYSVNATTTGSLGGGEAFTSEMIDEYLAVAFKGLGLTGSDNPLNN